LVIYVGGRSSTSNTFNRTRRCGHLRVEGPAGGECRSCAIEFYAGGFGAGRRFFIEVALVSFVGDQPSTPIMFNRNRRLGDASVGRSNDGGSHANCAAESSRNRLTAGRQLSIRFVAFIGLRR
jgi:hypothetical protein